MGMTEAEFFTRDRAMGLIREMIRQFDEDRMSAALESVLKGSKFAYGLSGKMGARNGA